jgi:hypothetical protein
MSAAPVSNAQRWTGRVLSGLFVLFMLWDAFSKITLVPQVVEYAAKMGMLPPTLVAVGSLCLACTVIYVIPRTAVLGAVLLTGYLGGAMATNMNAHMGTFPIVFAAVFAVIAWAGLILRRPYIIGWFFDRG